MLVGIGAGKGRWTDICCSEEPLALCAELNCDPWERVGGRVWGVAGFGHGM